MTSDPLYDYGVYLGESARCLNKAAEQLTAGFAAGYAEPEPELSVDDRIENAQADWNALPWYRRAWFWAVTLW